MRQCSTDPAPCSVRDACRGALETIDDTLDSAQRVVSRLLRDAEMAPGDRYAAVTDPQAAP